MFGKLSSIRNRRITGFHRLNGYLLTTLFTDFGDKMHQRCQQCRGQRYATGLGGMRKKCYVCNGVGYIDLSDSEEHDESYVEDSADIDDEQTEMEEQERDVEEVSMPPQKKSRNRRDE